MIILLCGRYVKSLFAIGSRESSGLRFSGSPKCAMRISLLLFFMRNSIVGSDCLIRASSAIVWFGLRETLKSTRRRIVLSVRVTSSINFMADLVSSIAYRPIAKKSKKLYNTTMRASVLETTYPITFQQKEAEKLGEYLRQRQSVDIVGMKRVGISNFLRFFLRRDDIISTYISNKDAHLFIPVDLNDLVEQEIYPFWTLTLKRVLDATEQSSLPS